MRRTTLLTASLAFLLGVGLIGIGGSARAQEASHPAQQGPGFADHTGHGFPNGVPRDQDRPNAHWGRGMGAFLDENGDGVNDWDQDFDGDGIVNRMDPDFWASRGRPMRMGGRHGWHGFVDLDGDGINDRFQDFDGDGIVNCQDPDWRASMGLGENAGRGLGGRGRHHGRSGMSNVPRANWPGRWGMGWNRHGRGFGRGFMGAPSGGNNGAGTTPKQMQVR